MCGTGTHCGQNFWQKWRSSQTAAIRFALRLPRLFTGMFLSRRHSRTLTPSPIRDSHRIGIIMNLQSIQKCLLQANTSYLVKNECLSKLSDLFRDQTILQDPSTQSDVRSIVKLLRDFSHHNDPRVRSAALTSAVS